MIKVLVTGSNGFVGRNLCAALGTEPERYEVFPFDLGTAEEQLRDYAARCDFVVHLAGVNRPKNEAEFRAGNTDLTERLLALLRQRPVPVAMTSSIQAALENPYGVSKRGAEEALQRYSRETGAPVYIWRMPNVFGKWCRPNYNSAVATFCNNIANGLPITVSDPAHEMTLIYIDDVVRLLIAAMAGEIAPEADGFCKAEPVYNATLGEIVALVESFRDSRQSLALPPLTGLAKPLYSTYLSYLAPQTGFAYPLTAHSDPRGLFAEFFKTGESGQFSVSTTAPGITRGNHWHHTKVEKFLVVSGEAAIRFRKIGESEVLEYRVCGNEPTVVDIPVGYTHSITNTSASEQLVTLIWANEPFDPEHPDTYRAEV